MPRLTTFTGIALILLGLGFYLGLTVAGGRPHVTAMIPVIPGVLLVALGLFAKIKPAWRKHVMHAAMVLGLAIVLAGLGRGVPGLLSEPGAGAVASILMAVIGLVFVALGVKSFIDARRGGAAEDPADR